MATRLVLSKEDPLQTDFLTFGNNVLYTSETINYPQPMYGSKAMTTVTRRDPIGGIWQVGTIEWPANPEERPRVTVGTSPVELTRTGLYTSPEVFQARDGRKYEWRIINYTAQLVPIPQGHSAASHVATLTKGSSGSIIRRKSSALLIPPEAMHILDDIVVTFIYFESQWRDRERFRARCWDHPVA